MGMKETKKMLGIIEKQYREANKKYQEEQKKKFKRECNKDFILCASIFLNVVILLTIIACR